MNNMAALNLSVQVLFHYFDKAIKYSLAIAYIFTVLLSNFASMIDFQSMINFG